jgi:hypothetical protein
MRPKKLGLAACLILTLTAWAAVAPAQFLTHLNQMPTDHVTLRGFLVTLTVKGRDQTQFYEFRRVFPDGHTDSGQFVGPEGKVLVLTDFEWSNDAVSGNEEYLTVRVHGQAGVSSRCISSDIGHIAQPGSSLNMPTGFVVEPGGWVEVPLYTRDKLEPKPRIGEFLFLRGYLTNLSGD